MTESDEDEHTPLLQQQSLPKRRPFSQFTVLIPIALATRCAGFLPSTTIIQIVETVVCRLWYEIHEPGRFPDAEACKIALVKERFAGTIAGLTTAEAVTSVFFNATIGYIASRYGRKPVMLVLMGVSAVGLVTLLSFNFLNGYNIFPLLAVWMVVYSIAELMPLVLNIIVVDVVAPAARTPKVSSMTGWGVLGSAPSFFVGGYISSYSRSNTMVFIISAVIMSLSFIYVLFLVPESFPESRRNKIREQPQRHTQPTTTAPLRLLKACLLRLLTPFESLRLIKPNRDDVTGKRSWAFFICSIYIFLANIGNGYATLVIILYLMTESGFESKDTGLVLTTYMVSSSFVLVTIIPWLSNHLRVLITSTKIANSNSSAHLSTPPKTSFLRRIPTDVYIIFFSWIISSILIICVGFAKTHLQVYLVIIGIAFASGQQPACRSLVVSLVEPILQAEALSAIETVGSLGTMLSPILLGTIFVKTVASAPMAVFYVHGVIVMTAASILFLVRDQDRYEARERVVGDEGESTSDR